jgi:hypothetical protein
MAGSRATTDLFGQIAVEQTGNIRNRALLEFTHGQERLAA